MKIEISKDDRAFINSLLEKSYVSGITKKLMRSEEKHPDSEDYIICEITVTELEDLVGELSYEANHNRKKITAAHACDIADSLENQLWKAKHANKEAWH